MNGYDWMFFCDGWEVILCSDYDQLMRAAEFYSDRLQKMWTMIWVGASF